jgi:single-stranded-DNA-specific exonuclease
MGGDNFIERDESAFFNSIKKMVQIIKNLENFVVVYHYDADGVTSGAIITKALLREGKKVKTKWLKQLYKENIDEILNLGENFIFVDFGSGQIDYLKKEIGEDRLFILDHHQPIEKNGQVVSTKWHINPLLFGINGGKEISGAGVVYFFSKELNIKNLDLSCLAIVGALGDMQDYGGQLEGLNRKIIDDAKEMGGLSVKIDLRLYGRISRPLISYLSFSSSPIIPGLTANEENCVAFLKENDIPIKDSFTEQWLSYEDLSLVDKKKLSSAIFLYLSSEGIPEWKLKELIGEVYTLEKENKKSPLRDGKEFATLLNSCGRHKMANIGLDVCLGDRAEKYGEALVLMQEHKNALRNGIQFVKKNGVEEKESFYFFDAGEEIEESIVGIIAGMLYGSFIEENKPIIALAKNKDGTIKVSGRGTSGLVRRGLNIGGALKSLQEKIPGLEGGGHRVAAGAKVPAKYLNFFLEELGVKFKEQLTKY